MSRSGPNILFITTDQQHPDYIGACTPRLKTPNLDRLCVEGTRFSRAYVCCPLCTPARASWITGQYPFRHGAWGVGTVLDKHCLSLPALLGEAGYRTAMIGKSHLEPGERHAVPDLTEGMARDGDADYFRTWTGPWYGFDHAEINVGHCDEDHSASAHYRVWLRDHGVDIGRYFGRHGPSFYRPRVWELPEPFHPCAWIAERSEAYLREHVALHPDRPFFLNINLPEPHGPMHTPEPWYSMYRDMPLGAPKRRAGEWRDKPTITQAVREGRTAALGWHGRFEMANVHTLVPHPYAGTAYTDREAEIIRIYCGMISLMDHYLGRVLDALDDVGLSHDTLVVFSSDHGDYMGDHFLMGKGACHYDGCVRVPTLARWPGTVKAGEVCKALINNIDIAPTFLAAAGLPVHPAMQGVSQLDVLCSRGATARDGVLVDFRAEAGLYVNSWITDRYRLSVHHTPTGNEVELYDLTQDPDEFINLAAEGRNGDLVARLMAELLAERSRTALPWQPRIAFA